MSQSKLSESLLQANIELARKLASCTTSEQASALLLLNNKLNTSNSNISSNVTLSSSSSSSMSVKLLNEFIVEFIAKHYYFSSYVLKHFTYNKPYASSASLELGSSCKSPIVKFCKQVLPQFLTIDNLQLLFSSSSSHEQQSLNQTHFFLHQRVLWRHLAIFNDLLQLHDCNHDAIVQAIFTQNHLIHEQDHLIRKFKLRIESRLLLQQYITRRLEYNMHSDLKDCYRYASKQRKAIPELWTLEPILVQVDQAQQAQLEQQELKQQEQKQKQNQISKIEQYMQSDDPRKFSIALLFHKLGIVKCIIRSGITCNETLLHKQDALKSEYEPLTREERRRIATDYKNKLRDKELNRSYYNNDKIPLGRASFDVVSKFTIGLIYSEFSVNSDKGNQQQEQDVVDFLSNGNSNCNLLMKFCNNDLERVTRLLLAEKGEDGKNAIHRLAMKKSARFLQGILNLYTTTYENYQQHNHQNELLSQIETLLRSLLHSVDAIHGRSVLHWAAHCGNTAVLKLLLFHTNAMVRKLVMEIIDTRDHGNNSKALKESKSKTSMTPLYAAHKSHEAMELLIKAGANVNKTSTIVMVEQQQLVHNKESGYEPQKQEDAVLFGDTTMIRYKPVQHVKTFTQQRTVLDKVMTMVKKAATNNSHAEKAVRMLIGHGAVTYTCVILRASVKGEQMVQLLQSRIRHQSVVFRHYFASQSVQQNNNMKLSSSSFTDATVLTN